MQIPWNNQGLAYGIVGVDPSVIYPNNMSGVSVNVCLVQAETDVALGLFDNTAQTIICTFSFIDQRPVGGDLLCNIQQVDNGPLSDGTATNPLVLAWNVSTEILYIGYNDYAKMATIVAANKTTFLQTKPTLNIFQNTLKLNEVKEIVSVSLYVPVAVQRTNSEVIASVDPDVNTTNVPTGVTVYDFNFYYNTSEYPPATTANRVFDNVAFYIASTSNLPN